MLQVQRTNWPQRQATKYRGLKKFLETRHFKLKVSSGRAPMELTVTDENRCVGLEGHPVNLVRSSVVLEVYYIDASVGCIERKDRGTYW